MGQSAKQKKETAERDARVVELHARGVTFEQIAALNIPGVGDKQQAHRCWKRGIASLPRIVAEEYRQVENVKLDTVERRLNRILNPESDPKDVIRAAQVLINLYKRRADLNGLDIRPTDAPGGSGIQTVLVDASVLLKSRRAPGDAAMEEEDDANGG